MNLLLSLISEYTYILIDVVAESTKWWRDNDMDGAKHRSELIGSAPKVFENDGMPVVIDSGPSFRFVYDNRGYFMEHRDSGSTVALTDKSLSRFRRRGLKGLRREAARLQRIKTSCAQQGAPLNR